jgi:2-polyprenyl-6-methoxyphenol hydroxylase-like FAD-dependent oxidoreductase
VLEFADGTAAAADVVIGADGVHSVVRGVVTEPAPPQDSGLCAFRAIVPAGRAPAFTRRRAQTLWLGPGHHLVHYPISGGSAVNIVAIAPASGYATESWSATDCYLRDLALRRRAHGEGDSPKRNRRVTFELDREVVLDVPEQRTPGETPVLAPRSCTQPKLDGPLGDLGQFL